MGMTLYLLRQHPDYVSPALFRAGDADTDVVFIERAVSMLPSSVKETMTAIEGAVVGLSCPMITYDDLVEKIFSSEQVIVL
jgi:hypothetical protein